MESVKFGRIKVKVGDSVSVPNDYFGTAFKDMLEGVGVLDERIYGCVLNVIEGNRKFDVKWDYDGQITSTCLDKVSYEAHDTPLQHQSSSVITAEDFEGLAGSLEQGILFVRHSPI